MKANHDSRAAPVLDGVAEPDGRVGWLLRVLDPVEALHEADDDIAGFHEGELLYKSTRNRELWSVLFLDLGKAKRRILEGAADNDGGRGRLD